MTLLIINTLIITLIIMCITALSPINLGMLVLSSAFFIAIDLSMVYSSWFGFITFIIYVGGMLVMFAYFAALQPNQHITNWSWLHAPMIFSVVIILFFNNYILNLSMNEFKIYNIYSMHNSTIPILMALILFLALIMVVKTAQVDKGPLRPFS
uniref:NADH dehydrogenase subunit 6 n=1 Tax=Platynereis bicanaliculata TaxID=868042 RepID=A0A7G8JTM1_9ANNE|nr:NADH dehydrogenase subunit 6 [Platynereis bicanaliculata]QNJ33919.1 NADH dehydrogenase subunit 6 [Platynereis bicanaliculata]